MICSLIVTLENPEIKESDYHILNMNVFLSDNFNSIKSIRSIRELFQIQYANVKKEDAKLI